MELICKITDKDILGTEELSNAEPRYTARAILKNDKDQYAVMHTKKFDLYSLPGGGIEGDESEPEALRREVLEETGCICDRIEEIGCIYENRAHCNYTQYSYYYFVNVGNCVKENSFTDIEIQNETEVQWHSLEKVRNLIFNQKPSTNQQKFLQARDVIALKKYISEIAINSDKMALLSEIQWIFFDIGSTLVDETECYRARYAETVEGTDITCEEFENKVIEFSKQNKKGDHEAVKYFNLTLAKWHKELEMLYPETKAVLKNLFESGYKLGIIANQSLGTEKRLEEWGILKYFDIVIASAEEGVAKPDKEIFLRALSRAGCKPENAVMVGDRLDNDIVPANKIGMKTVWIKQGLGGYSTPHTLPEYPDITADNLTELCELFIHNKVKEDE